MLNKLRLNQSDDYQRAVATKEIAKMLVNFVQERKHYLSVGSEQGEFSKWDDLVIEEDINSYIYIQIKNQTTDFGTTNDECKRNTYIKDGSKHKQGELRDLSEFDKTIKELAIWSENIDITNISPERKFIIILPELATHIKKDLTVRILKDLCENQIKPISRASDLHNLALEDSNIKCCYEWLKTWCNFKGWDHIIKAFQFLNISTVGTKSDIIKDTEEILSRVFVQNKCSEIRNKINSYTIENSSFSSAISPRNLLFELKDYLHHDIKTWTQFEKIDSQWNISGIHDLL